MAGRQAVSTGQLGRHKKAQRDSGACLSLLPPESKDSALLKKATKAHCEVEFQGFPYKATRNIAFTEHQDTQGLSALSLVPLAF